MYDAGQAEVDSSVLVVRHVKLACAMENSTARYSMLTRLPVISIRRERSMSGWNACWSAWRDLKARRWQWSA